MSDTNPRQYKGQRRKGLVLDTKEFDSNPEATGTHVSILCEALKAIWAYSLWNLKLESYISRTRICNPCRCFERRPDLVDLDSWAGGGVKWCTWGMTRQRKAAA